MVGSMSCGFRGSVSSRLGCHRRWREPSVLWRKGHIMKQFGVGTGNSQGTVDLVLLVLRVVAGLVFFMHGYQKLFDDDLSTTQTGFDGMGAPLPDITAVIVMFVELIGGLALILGALTGIFAALHLIDMVSAFVIVHVENGFFVMKGGFELVFLLAGAA